MTRRTIEIIAFFVALLLVGLALHAWLASRDEQQRLQSTLVAQKKLLDAADIRERDRNAALHDALAQIAELKHTVQTPEQIVRDLPKYLSLPQPITLSAPSAPSASISSQPKKPAKKRISPSPQQGTGLNDARAVTSQSSQASAVSAPNPEQNTLPDALSKPGHACDPPNDCNAQIPSADLKALYDYVQDCRACQAELSVAKQNASDDAAKIAALTTERDAAITAAKGGTFWRRLRRNALWFIVGAGVGSAAGFAVANR